MRITKHVSFVGSQNPALRVFDIIMATNYGTSYNSYLIHGEEYAIIETVHENYVKDFIDKIEREVLVKDIKYVILNHTEPDHTGSLRYLLDMNPNLLVIGSSAAIKNAVNITNREFLSRVVKTGDTLDLGDGVLLEFISAPNLHWPDSMFTYFKKEKVLFSCDFFGCHFCEPMVLDKHLIYNDAYLGELRSYYDSIFSPFKKFVLAGIGKVKDLEITTICSCHGPVLQEKVEEVMNLYAKWSKEEERTGIAIFYVSAYGYTKKMAETFADEFRAAEEEVQLYHMLDHSEAEMAHAMNTAKAVLFGSPTINKDALKPVWDLISATEVINLRNKPALVFGSYGWSGEAVPLLCDRLAGIKYNVYKDGVKCVFNPTEEDLENVRAAARDFIS